MASGRNFCVHLNFLSSNSHRHVILIKTCGLPQDGQLRPIYKLYGLAGLCLLVFVCHGQTWPKVVRPVANGEDLA